MVGRNIKRRKSKTIRPRRKTGLAGAPMDKGWRYFQQYLHDEADRKEVAGVIRDWIRSTQPPKAVKKLLGAPEWCYSAQFNVASTIMWEEAKLEFPEGWDSQGVFDRYLEMLHEQIDKKSDSEEPKVGRSPMDIVKERTKEFVAEVEEYLDNWLDPASKMSIFEKLNAVGAPYITAKAVYDRFKPLKDELDELLLKNDEQLMENYSYLDPKVRKAYAEFVTKLVAEAEQYMNNKKALRTTKPKVRTAAKQVAKLNFMKSSDDFKITSIDPTKLIGAMRCFIFVTNSKRLVEFVSSSPTGFEVKGSTLMNVDMEKSRLTQLRKPLEVLPVVQSKPITKIKKMWDGLTTKTKPIESGRINKHAILISVFDK